MKYLEIKEKLSVLKIFTLQDIFLVDPPFRQPTLYEWVKKGLVIQLRQNRFVFSDFKPQGLDYFFLANKLIQPSYVSLEMALYHYNIIPELVHITTSVTSKKTVEYTTPFGTFSYKTILPDLFVGYQIIQHQSHGVQVAFLEKAILDYLYLHHEIHDLDDFEELRWNADLLRASINNKRYQTFEKLFDNKALQERSTIFQAYIGGL